MVSNCIISNWKSRDKYGYAVKSTAKRINGKTKWGKKLAHREAYKQYVGEIPEGMVVCHSCDNPPCVNPQHLWVGTPKQNNDDKIAKGRHPKGTQSPNAKLTEDIVIEIKIRLTEGERPRDLAREFDVTDGLIGHIKSGRKWVHVK